MAAAHQSITAGGGEIIGVGAAAPYQARHLMDTTIPFRLLLDPNGALLERLGGKRQTLLRYVFNLRAWLRWVRGFVTHRRQYRITGHYSEVPAVAVVDRDAQVTFVHRGSGIGDYPALEDVIASLHQLTES